MSKAETEKFIAWCRRTGKMDWTVSQARKAWRESLSYYKWKEHGIN